MVKAHAYGSLGEILTAGGDAYMATQAAAGFSGPQLLAIAAAAFPHVSGDDHATLVDIAERAANAGREATAAVRRGEPFEGKGGVNPYLFGDEPEGRRHLIKTDAIDPTTGEKIAARAELATLKELAEEMQRLANQAKWIRDRYSEKFKGTIIEYDPSQDMEIKWIISRF